MTAEKDVPRGGVIPFYIDNEEIKMLFMVPSDPKFGGPDWQIAKGKIDPEDQSIEDGAFREAQEELGLFLPNISERHDLGQFGNIRVYLAHIKDPNLFGDHDEETGAVRWMTPEEFAAEGRSWQRPIVKAAVRKIQSSMKVKDKVLEYFHEDLYEMSNLSSRTTGLPGNVVVWIRTEPGESPHTKYRFKVKSPQEGTAIFGFWGDEVQHVAGDWIPTGRMLQSIRDFATANREVLTQHIDGEIDSVELGQGLRKAK